MQHDEAQGLKSAESLPSLREGDEQDAPGRRGKGPQKTKSMEAPLGRSPEGHLGVPSGGPEAGLLVPLLGRWAPGPHQDPGRSPCACPTDGTALGASACPGPGPMGPTGSGASPAPSWDTDAPPLPGGTALLAARALLLLAISAWPAPGPAGGGRVGSETPAALLGEASPPRPSPPGGSASSTRSGAGLSGRPWPRFLLFLGVTHWPLALRMPLVRHSSSLSAPLLRSLMCLSRGEYRCRTPGSLMSPPGGHWKSPSGSLPGKFPPGLLALAPPRLLVGVVGASRAIPPACPTALLRGSGLGLGAGLLAGVAGASAGPSLGLAPRVDSALGLGAGLLLGFGLLTLSLHSPSCGWGPGIH